mmetsp:Transcript_11946/g.28982  ORF Transcript_11946/g.28982 Transcript_11946/m.28982 type:complete len:280 (-) Transcript_11946:360-1199(-)
MAAGRCPSRALTIAPTALASSVVSAAPGDNAAITNSAAASTTAVSSAARAAMAPRISPPRDCASWPGDKTMPPPPRWSRRNHASAACSAAARSPDIPWAASGLDAASRTLSDSPKTSIRRGMRTLTRVERAARSVSLTSSATAAWISRARVNPVTLTPPVASPCPARSSACCTSAVVASAPDRVAAAAITRHSRRAASTESGLAESAWSCWLTAATNCPRCASGNPLQSDLTLPYSMLAPKYRTLGSGVPTSCRLVSHASGVEAKATKKSLASRCCAGF